MEQVDKAMDLIKTKYLIYHISYEGISGVKHRSSRWKLSGVTDECVAHKDYASAVPIQISVFPDHITFLERRTVTGKLDDRKTF